MTSTEAEKRQAFEDFEKTTGGKVVKVQTGPRVKNAEKIALVEAAETVPEPEPAATPETVAPTPAKRTGTAPSWKGGEFIIWKGITARVSPPTGEVYQVEFLRDGRRLCIETTKSPMWESPNLQDKAAAAIDAAIDAASPGDEDRPTHETIRKKIREAFAAFAEQVKTDIKVQEALLSEPVRRFREAVRSVVIYPSQATTYEIEITGGNLTIPAKVMARADPGFINEAWINLFPTKPLYATRKDWLDIQEYLMSDDRAVIREAETITEAEMMIDRLRLELESVSLVESPDLVNDTTAWRDPGTGEIWVPARRITRFLDETAKKPEWSSMLSKEVRAAGWMKSATRTKMLGSPPRKTRCWVFVADFTTSRDTRNPPAIVSEYVSNTGGGTGDL